VHKIFQHLPRNVVMLYHVFFR